MTARTSCALNLRQYQCEIRSWSKIAFSCCVEQPRNDMISGLVNTEADQC